MARGATVAAAGLTKAPEKREAPLVSSTAGRVPVLAHLLPALVSLLLLLLPLPLPF